MSYLMLYEYDISYDYDTIGTYQCELRTVRYEHEQQTMRKVNRSNHGFNLRVQLGLCPTRVELNITTLVMEPEKKNITSKRKLFDLI